MIFSEGASNYARRGKNFEAFLIRKTVVDLYKNRKK